MMYRNHTRSNIGVCFVSCLSLFSQLSFYVAALTQIIFFPISHSNNFLPYFALTFLFFTKSISISQSPSFIPTLYPFSLSFSQYIFLSRHIAHINLFFLSGTTKHPSDHAILVLHHSFSLKYFSPNTYPSPKLDSFSQSPFLPSFYLCSLFAIRPVIQSLPTLFFNFYSSIHLNPCIL